MASSTFFIPSVNVIGADSLTDAMNMMADYGFTRTLIVTDNMLTKLGMAGDVQKALEERNIFSVIYDGTQPNPTTENVAAGLKLLKENNCDSVISLGGGSPHDCAKGIALVAANGGDIRDYEGVDRSAKPQLPMIAINTTAGTASEMTRFCIITDEARHIKMAIVDKHVTPLLSVNDSSLMIGMPKSLTAATGMDALTHAIEAYVSIAATPITDACALKAVTMIAENLPLAVEDGSNAKAREAMAYAQFLAGMAFNNASLGYVHAMAHQLGGFYNLPHGVCNAVLLPHVQVFNSKVAAARLRDCAAAMGVNVTGKNDAEGAEACINAIRELAKKVDIPAGLRDLNVKEEDFASHVYPCYTSHRKETIMTNNPPSAQIKPGEYGFPLKLKARYDNFIGGEWVAPADGEYYQNLTPVTGQLLCEVASSGKRDIDLALDAAHKVKDKWAHTSVQDRAAILFKIADRMEQNLELLATAETWDNGKPIRETSAADVPLAIDHFRYFASCIRAQEGGISEVDSETVAYHFHEPLGVVGQIIPWNFPLLMASWKMAPALAAGNCVVLKPARLTPLSVLLLMEIVGDLLPPGVVNVVNGAGGEIGEYLATSKRIAKVAFTGSTEVGQQIMQYATQNIIPVTLELGGKSPNIFFADVMDEEDAFFDKALEGFALFAFNQGEVCTCPSRALVQESIYERFMERAIRRVESIRSGNPLDSVTQMGAQVSHGQLETILNYIDIGKKEGADVLTGGRRKLLEGELKDGYYLEPTILFGQNNMRVFQEEIFGPVLAVTTFKTMDEALELANDTQYGLGAGVWSRNGNLAYKMGRGIQAGRVWTNCYHAYPAHAAFGGYKQSGIGRETHKMMLEHYQQTKCLLVSYSDKPLGLF